MLVSTRTSQKFALPIELMSLDSGMLHASIFFWRKGLLSIDHDDARH